MNKTILRSIVFVGLQKKCVQDDSPHYLIIHYLCHYSMNFANIKRPVNISSAAPMLPVNYYIPG
ncbi:MAG: hypothetical protein C5B59_02395 [Bacteroidetes bacterium]|nr:MAG: hypothetical protein C5B59_02395 [Bacteroidota bacterium]